MSLLLKNLLFTFLVPGTVAVYLPLRLARGLEPATGVWRGAACLLLGAGVAIYAWCVWDFARFGRGTPAPIDAPKRLVVRGLYRYVRNPMYVGVLCVILGQALLFRSPGLGVYALAVGSVFHLFVILYEEKALRRSFGADYERYCSAVSRWWPGPGADGGGTR